MKQGNHMTQCLMCKHHPGPCGEHRLGSRARGEQGGGEETLPGVQLRNGGDQVVHVEGRGAKFRLSSASRNDGTR